MSTDSGGALYSSFGFLGGDMGPVSMSNLVLEKVLVNALLESSPLFLKDEIVINSWEPP